MCCIVARIVNECWFTGCTEIMQTACRSAVKKLGGHGADKISFEAAGEVNLHDRNCVKI